MSRKTDHHGHHLQSKASRMIHTLVSWLHGDGGEYEIMENNEDGAAARRGEMIKGSVPVYVGHLEQRFPVKLEHINHPLFRKLLELTEQELGFCDNSRLVIPCNVGMFKRVLARIDAEESGRKPRSGNDKELCSLFESICRGS